MSETAGAPPIRVTDELLASILSPYKPHCRYLRAAEVSVPAPADGDEPAPVVVLRGELAIPESCYIDDTGHFNSVEFNLCFNQLFYTLVGQCVVSGLLPELGDMTLDEYLQRQLPDVLIHDFSSVFKRAMDSERFTGELVFHNVSDRKRFVFFKTSCTFRDASGGHCEGDVTLVLVNRTDRTSATASTAAEGRR